MCNWGDALPVSILPQSSSSPYWAISFLFCRSRKKKKDGTIPFPNTHSHVEYFLILQRLIFRWKHSVFPHIYTNEIPSFPSLVPGGESPEKTWGGNWGKFRRGSSKDTQRLLFHVKSMNLLSIHYRNPLFGWLIWNSATYLRRFKGIRGGFSLPKIPQKDAHLHCFGRHYWQTFIL